MNNPQSAIRNPQSRVLIVGAGPAGSSLAIRLARDGFETVLIERERFPRQKLCGEFISPECLEHFEKLDILDGMLDAGGDRIVETRFFETGGTSIAVPTGWFGKGEFALSLSRAEMDDRLLQKARSVGAEVLDETSVSGLDCDGGRATNVRVRRADGTAAEIAADIFIDATGRSRVLAKLAEKAVGDNANPSSKPEFVGFKSHIDGAGISPGVCEIYSFDGGYAGLSNVEGGLANLCFLIRSRIVRSFGSDVAEIVNQIVTRNNRAADTLRDASFPNEWLAVSIDGFGKRSPTPMSNLFTVGDAAAFIDPFTGSGMVMALESSDVLARILIDGNGSLEEIGGRYRLDYEKQFTRRLRICSILRRTAFMPRVATTVVSLLRLSAASRRLLARATRR